MLPDHLSEEGPAEFEEIEIPCSIIFLLVTLFTILYVIHFNGHFYIFGSIARISLRIYGIWTKYNTSFTPCAARQLNLGSAYLENT